MGQVRRSSARRVNSVDEALMRRSAALPRTAADPALLRLSRSANHSLIWFAVAGALAVRKGSSRRAGLRGVVAIGAASTAANLIGKPVFPRRRPAAELVPEHRRLQRRPTSSSFPSGHSASAAAFTTAVAMENPLLAVAVAPVAAGVAYSRVHTGVHWPSDVLAGIGIGIGVATATRHWWPRMEASPPHPAHRVEAPPLGDGGGVLVLINPNSGPDDVDPTEEIRGHWPAATILHTEPDTDVIDQVTAHLTGNGGENGAANGAVRALAVAGGDGTVAAVAAVAAEHGLPLALLPAGTLNHFARDIGLTTEAETVTAASAGAAVCIDLTGVQTHEPDGGTEHRWFVNTASLGGYPEMVRLREKLEHRWGKWPAAAIALVRTLRHARPIPVELNGKRTAVWMLFVGNGNYQPKGFAPTSRPDLDGGTLDVRYLRADLPYSRARFVVAALTRTLTTSHVYRQQDLTELDVVITDGHRRLATDGEVGPLGSRFVFRSRPGALTVYRP